MLAVNQVAYILVTTPGYAGAVTIGNTSPTVASATIDGNSIVTISALANGSSTISVSDGGASNGLCPVTVN